MRATVTSISQYVRSLTLKVSGRLVTTLEDDVVRARLKTSPYTIAKTLILASTLTALMIPLLTLTLGLPFTALSCVPVLALSPIPLVKLALRIHLHGREASIDRELRLFKVYASMLASGGLHLYEVFRRIVGRGMFPNLEEEARVAVRNVEVLGMDPRSGLEEMAKTSPSRRLQELVYNYTALELSGGDTSRYLEEEAREALKSIEYDAKLYSERVSVYGEVLVGMLLMFSMLTGVGAVLSPTAAIDMLTVQLTVVIPLTTVFIWILVDTTQPKMGISYSPSWRVIALGAVGSAVILALMGPGVASASASVSMFLLCIGVDYARVKRVGEEEEKVLTTLLRELVEYRKIGYAPIQALERILERSPRFNLLDRMLREVIVKVRAGIRPSQIRVNSPSWLVRAVFNILGDVEDAGGGDPAVLEALYGMVDGLRTVKRRISVNARLYEVIAYATPILLAVASGFTLGLCNVLSQAVQNVNLGATPFHNVEGLKRPLELLIMVSSLSMGLLSSKISECTVKGTLKAGVVMVIATLSILFLGRIADIVAGLMV